MRLLPGKSNCTCARTCLPKRLPPILKMLVALLPGYDRNTLDSKPPGSRPLMPKPIGDHLLARRYAPTTINRALISLMLFFDTIEGTNPFRHLTMIDIVELAPVALSKTEWNAVRRCAEAAARRDHGLALHW